MATVTENFNSRETTSDGKESTQTRLYSIDGVDDYDDAIDEVTSASPTSASVGGQSLTVRSIKVEPIGDGSKWWTGTVEYRSVNSNKSGGSGGDGIPPTPAEAPRVSFDFGGETTRLFEAIKQYEIAFGAAVLADDRFINETVDGIEGVDIISPYGVYEETKTYADATITAAWHRQRLRLISSVNDTTFRGYEPGELRLDGISGAPRADGFWDITYRWSVRPNEDNYTAGTETFAKKGWYYVWVLWRDIPQSNGINRVPSKVYYDQVYPETDFNLIV